MRVICLLRPKGTVVHPALLSLGWDEQWTELHAATVPASAHSDLIGRVARVDRGAVDVLTSRGDGDEPSIVRAAARADLGVAVGDWVTASLEDASAGTPAMVSAVLPRRTAIQRALASGRSEAHVLVANVDLVVVTVPTVPEPRLGMVERLVALAWESGATPVVVVTKADLVPDPEGIAADVAATAPGVEVVFVDAVTAGGLDPLSALLTPGRTACLLGRSGAGKSTLTNKLLGHRHLEVADIRRDGKGRHTTTHRELLVLPGGAVLIDTPGLRGAGLWVGDDGLDRTFADVDALIEQCRFGDCAHETEPGCAVRAAVDDGTLPTRRFESWRKLQREAAWMARRNDARLRSEQRRAWKLVQGEVRRSGRIRP